MKIRLLLPIVGLAISFAVAAFAQQTNTPDPKLREQLVAFFKKLDDAYNNNESAALAPLYTEDAVLVAPEGPIYGREAIAKFWVALFQKVHFSNHFCTVDQYSPHAIGTAGGEIWATGKFRQTTEGIDLGNGYWSMIFAREGDAWKMRLMAITPELPKFQVPSSAQQINTPDPNLREQIVALLGKFTEAWNNNDATALAALYTKDAVFCGGEGSGPHYGREAIEKHFAEGFKLFHFSNHLATPDQYSPHVIGAAGNEVWAIGEWSMTVQSKNGGSPMQIKGNWGDIFVREGDGWKARMVVTNNAAPAPEPAQTK